MPENISPTAGLLRPIALGAGLVLTLALATGPDPVAWGPLSHLTVLGPILLAIGLALGPSGRPGPEVPPKAIFVGGLVLLAVGGFPWVYTPLIFGGDNTSSGMLGTLLFLLIGLPGLAATLFASRGFELAGGTAERSTRRPITTRSVASVGE